MGARKYVKLDKNTQKLGDHNLQVVREHIKAGIDHITYQGILCALADAFDEMAKGTDLWIAIGLTKDRDAFLLTVKSPDGKARAGGLTLAELSKDAEKLV
jgi:hypothetical protein